MFGIEPVDVASFLLQFGGPPEEMNRFVWDVNPVVGLVSNAISTFVLTFVVGAIMIAVAPEYTERKMDAVRTEPVESFLYGILLLVGLVIVTFLMLVTLILIPVALFSVLLLGVVLLIGSAIAFLAIGERLVDHGEDDWMKPLLVGAALNGGLVLTGVGGLVSFCIGAAGFGAILRDRL